MFKTLRSKFLLFILVPAIIGLLVLSVLSYLSARGLLLSQMKEAGLNFLQASAERISGRIGQIRSILQVMALAENLVKKSEGERRRLFVKLSDMLGENVTSVFMGFPNGKFIRAKTDPLPADYDPRKRPWYIEAVGLPPGVMDGLTTPYLDASTKRPVITIYRKVLKNDGSLLGVIGVDVDVASTSQSLMERVPLLAGGQPILVNTDATVLLHPDDGMIGMGIGSTGESLDMKISEDIKNPETQYGQYLGERLGGRWYMGFHRIGETKACILLMVPIEKMPEPLRWLTFRMGGLATLFVIGVFIVLVIMTKRVSRPIVDLTASTVKVIEEDSYQEPLEVKSRDEVGRLTTAFNSMMEGLRQRDFIRDTFGRYVTKEVVTELLDTPDGLKLGGEKREVTIMFTDLRGFTPLSERLSPDEVIGILNRYLGKMADIVSQYEGTVNEFAGDGLLAFFGAPIKRDDGPVRTVACAVAMQLAMEDINRQNRELGLPPIAMGVGINTGEVIVGNVGSENRTKYGAVGHHINLASRVEGTTIGGQILITPSTYERVKDTVIVQSARSFKFKGVDQDVTLYEVVGVREPFNLVLPAETRDTKPLRNPMRVTVLKMHGKEVESSPLAGELTHYSKEWIQVSLGEHLNPSMEIGLDIPIPQREGPERMYARVVEATEKDGSYAHLVRISYLSPEAADIIESLTEKGIFD
jgi:class 3 adenylate cyclase